MAGTNSSFSAKEFRTGIRFAMDMGAAPIGSDQASFIFASALTYNQPSDDENVPFDPASTVTSSTPSPVHVSCAIQYFDRDGQPTVFGELVPSRVEITLLDQEYVLVKDAIGVVLGGELFKYGHTEPPTGLFDVGLFKIHYSNENDL